MVPDWVEVLFADASSKLRRTDIDDDDDGEHNSTDSAKASWWVEQ